MRVQLLGWWLVVSLVGTLAGPPLAAARADDALRTPVLCAGGGLVRVTAPAGDAPGEAPGARDAPGCGAWCAACAGSDDDPASMRGADWPDGTRAAPAPAAAPDLPSPPSSRTVPPPARGPPV